MMRRLRQLSLLGVVATLLLSGCASPAGHARWLRSHDIVASVESSRLTGRKFGERLAWHVVATLTPEATAADMGRIAAGWPARANDSQLTLVRPASGEQPELVFTAWPKAGWTEPRWEMLTLLQSTWPAATVTMGTDQAAVVSLEGCDPWDELARIDVAGLQAREHRVPLTFDCNAGGRVELSRRSVPTTDHLTHLRDRTRAVLSHLPAGTPWSASADRPEEAVQIEVSTPDIPTQPTSSVLAQEHAQVTIRPAEPAGRLEVTVTGDADLRDVARATAQLPWLTGITVHSGRGRVELAGDLARIQDLVPLTDQHPDLSWRLSGPGNGRANNWVRSPGAEFGESARQYQALVDSRITWTKIVLHHNHGRPTLSVETETEDWRPVVEAVRRVGWEGDLHVEIGPGYPQVAFTSTATGPARDATVAAAHRPPDPERHPELIAILRAWDATAS